MATIIAGKFELQNQAQKAAEELARAGFPQGQISYFYVNPPGQHDRFPIGGDRDKSPGAEDTPAGTATGAATGGALGAAVGIATTPLVGPVGPVTGALVGAHIGQLVGTLGATKEDGGAPAENPVPVRHAGMMVAVSVPDADKEQRAINLLRSLGAREVERAEGTIDNGDWADFDPVKPPTLVEGRTTHQ